MRHAVETTPERFHGLDEGDTIELLMHLHRYRIAASQSAGRRVLDFGSGDGYGSRLLASTAREVVGLDYDAAAVEAASRKYRQANLRFEHGSVTELLAQPSGSYDLIACFEVVEHLPEKAQHEMVAAFAHALSPAGLVVASTPNASVKQRHYQRFPDWRNPYHVRELDEDELTALFSRHFAHVVLLPQGLEVASVVGAAGEAAVPPHCTWVNIVVASPQPITLHPSLPLATLPAQATMIEDLLAGARWSGTEVPRLREQVRQLNEENARLHEALTEGEDHRNRLLIDIDRLSGQVFALHKQIVDLERVREDLVLLKRSLSYRAAHFLDRWPRLKDALIRVGNSISPS